MFFLNQRHYIKYIVSESPTSSERLICEKDGLKKERESFLNELFSPELRHLETSRNEEIANKSLQITNVLRQGQKFQGDQSKRKKALCFPKTWGGE